MAGHGPLDTQIRDLQRALSGSAAGDADTWTRLAQSLVHKARQVSDDRLYAQAEDAASRALRVSPQHAGARHVQLALLLQQHRFRDAHRQAADLLRQAPRDATAWGALGDAAIELGDYAAAQRAYQAMIDLKPDLRSYSRGAWLRYLFGDGDGAIDLMQQAIDAGSVREPESRAYCRVHRAELLSLRGRYAEAQTELEQALAELPGYAAAQAARGRLLLHAHKDARAALPELYAALSTDPQPSTRIALLVAHEALGQTQEASEQQRTILQEGPRHDPRAVAIFMASRKQQPDLALRLAQSEAQQRPDLWSADALAWTLFHSDRVEEAWLMIQRAAEPGIIDPRIDFHRGVIAHARGDHDSARTTLQRALATSPQWDLRDAATARALLQQLDRRPQPVRN